MLKITTRYSVQAGMIEREQNATNEKIHLAAHCYTYIDFFFAILL